MNIRKKILFYSIISIIALLFLHVKCIANNIETTEIIVIKDDGSKVTMLVDNNIKEFELFQKHIIRVERLDKLLKLNEINFTQNSISTLQWIPEKIKSLILYYNHLKDLKGIEKITSLEYAVFGQNQIINIDEVFSLPFLKYLELSSNHIQIINCSDNNSLEEIHLDNNKIEEIYNLNKLRKLKKITLFGNPIAQNMKLINKLRKENPGIEIIAKYN